MRTSDWMATAQTVGARVGEVIVFTHVQLRRFVNAIEDEATRRSPSSGVPAPEGAPSAAHVVGAILREREEEEEVQQAEGARASDRVPNNDHVICPECCYQFRAIPVNVQAQLNATPSGTEGRVCEDIARRQKLGIAKYGKSVIENPLSLYDWLRHAYEECLDQAVYLKRAQQQIEALDDDHK